MVDRELTALVAGRNKTPVEGRPGWTLRLLSAAEVLEARREAGELAADGKERAVCSNACLLARALERGGKAVFDSGKAALAALRAYGIAFATVEEIEALAGAWAVFNQTENPSPEDGEERVNALKKAWSTRLMSALNGACSKLLAFCPGRNRHGG